MKIFKTKKFTHKLIIAIVCIILFNFCMAPNVHAIGTSFGGKMMSLVSDFSTAIADVIASLVQFGLTGHLWWPVDDAGTGEHETSTYWIKQDKFQYPILQVSPEIIFANKVQLLDVNFISNIKDSSEYLLSLDDTSALYKLRSIIAGWYVTLRTIAIVRITFSFSLYRYKDNDCKYSRR